MSQFLPRGYKLSSEKRIRKPIAEGQDWQIYLTNVDSYALVVKPGLYEKWVSNYSLPKGLFSDSNSSDYKLLESSGDYLISSLEKGPFPDNAGQIEAFSIAFKTALSLFPTSDFYGAIYIEEYSLLLPSFLLTENPRLYRGFKKALAVHKKTPSDIIEVRSGNCTKESEGGQQCMTIIV